MPRTLILDQWERGYVAGGLSTRETKGEASCHNSSEIHVQRKWKRLKAVTDTKNKTQLRRPKLLRNRVCVCSHIFQMKGFFYFVKYTLIFIISLGVVKTFFEVYLVCYFKALIHFFKCKNKNYHKRMKCIFSACNLWICKVYCHIYIFFFMNISSLKIHNTCFIYVFVSVMISQY